ncbi:MAG: hypothetical protein AB8G96_07690 [Phycisphaerales bacterium]
MRVRFVTVAEANQRFGEMALLWAWSIRRRGGMLADADVTVVFNEREDEALSERLRRESNVDVRVMPRISTSHPERNKFNAFRIDGLEDDDWVILSDVDMCVCDHLDGLHARLAEDDFDLGVTPAGIDPRPPLPLLRGLDKLLRQETGLTRAQLAEWEHPWFADHAPYSRWPYISGGLFVVRGRHVREFGDEILQQTKMMYEQMRTRQPNPWRVLRNFYNYRVHRLGRWSEPLIIGWWFMARLADQVAISTAMIRMKLRPTYLDHTYNWRYMDSGQGEELPVRFLHYFGSMARASHQDLLAGDWTDAYAADDHPGRQALADVTMAYRADPVTGGSARVEP